MNEVTHVSVIIPAFNEAERIAPTLRATSAWLQAQSFSYDIIVVNDGSTDTTMAVVTALTQELPQVRVINSVPNEGKGFVVRVGMLKAEGSLRLFMDADNSTPIQELPKLILAITEGAAVAIGSRRANRTHGATKSPWYRRGWSRIANRVVRQGLVNAIYDTQCGFKLFTADAAHACFSRAKINGWAFDLEILALAQALGYKVVEVPVVWVHDERTKVSPLQDAIKTTKEFLRISRSFKRGDYNL